MARLNIGAIDVEDEVVAGLERRAAAHDRSLEDEIRQILRVAAETEKAAFLAAARRLREQSRPFKQTDSVLLLREDRER